MRGWKLAAGAEVRDWEKLLNSELSFHLRDGEPASLEAYHALQREYEARKRKGDA